MMGDRMKKKKVRLYIFCIILLLLVLSAWLENSRIKVSVSTENTAYANHEQVAIWKSDLGMSITIQRVENKLDYKDIVLEKVKKLSNYYIIYYLDVKFTPKVETLFVDIPINKNTVLKLKNRGDLQPVNKEIIDKYFPYNNDIKKYLTSFFEETMSNNSPFTSIPITKKGILIFQKEDINIIKSLEFQVFNSESDIGKCKIIFEDNVND